VKGCGGALAAAHVAVAVAVRVLACRSAEMRAVVRGHNDARSARSVNGKTHLALS
jgi:hypothetical protein